MQSKERNREDKTNWFTTPHAQIAGKYAENKQSGHIFKTRKKNISLGTYQERINNVGVLSTSRDGTQKTGLITRYKN